MNESGFTQAIMKKLPKGIYKWKIMNSMQNGIPDCFFSGVAGDLWVEVKYISTPPKRANTDVSPKLSELQRKWLNDRYDEGRDVAVLLGSPSGNILLMDKDWNNRIVMEDLNQTRAQVVHWITKQTLG